MARKIFVTYKYNDEAVQSINGETTARAYVDELIDLFEGCEIYKGEGDEDLSELKDETIASRLRDKIHDSTITLVLISPNMKEKLEFEYDQWIPWEVSYSLKKTSRSGRTSQTNAILAVVLPDNNFSYDYFLQEDSCPYCRCTTYDITRLFQILRDNMFNIKQPSYNGCSNHTDANRVHTGQFSYIPSVKWESFVADTENCLKRVENIRDDIDAYNITKEIDNEQ